MDGLLIKQILRTCQSEALNDEKAASFLRRVEKIAFLATPHAGADLAVWGDRLRILIRPSAATICLVRNDSNLRDLNLWYRGWSNHQNITHLVLTETKSLSILGMIVKPDSSDPGLPGKRPRPMDYDHGAICKPRSRTSDTYIAVRSFIELPFERPRDLVAERLEVTAQVGDLVQDRRRDFAKDVGSQVRASMMAQPCFLAVEKNERMSAKSTAPSTERKPPEIFWRNFIMRPSRSA